MIRSGTSSILVVGAGPVGLVTAIALREQGLPVRVVDSQAADTKRTYPAIIHPRTLRTLSSLGMKALLEWRGHHIQRLALYTEGIRRATLELPAAGEPAPGAMTLPQDALREALMQRLSELGTLVEWQTRLRSLAQDDAGARVELARRERVEGASPELGTEWLDVASETVDAPFVIGADGIQSSVRRLLGIQWLPHGSRQIYAFYDAPDGHASDEAQLAFHERLGSSVYPLQNDVSRFTFQVSVSSGSAPTLSDLRRLLDASMPWYTTEAPRFEWSGTAEFNPALAERFGEGRVWLVGDAAHSTGPLGGQSLNVGIHEGVDLAHRIAEHQDRPAASPVGLGYGQQRRLEWQRLLGSGTNKADLTRSEEWLRRHFDALLPALPAAGDDLDDLLDQLGVETP